MMQRPRQVLFHDSFCQMGGAERVAEELHRALLDGGEVDLHSTLSADEILTPYLQQVGIHNSWMQWLPLRSHLFRAYFLLYPLAVEHADLCAYDLVVSSCFGYAKGVRRADRAQRPLALHICYCHTPMRWVWRTDDYLAREGNSRLKAAILALPLRWLRRWEMRAARRPDLYIANSEVVAKRLRDAFGIEATVIPPPVDTARFMRAGVSPVQPDEALLSAIPPDGEFYLVLSRLVPYKRYDLAIQACLALGRRLVIIGGGTDRIRLETLAAGHPSITFLGRAPDEVVAEYARRCRALLFPGEEDFGITPLEINAAGKPVVAFRGGGATETIVDGLNGVFFDQPSPESLADAMLRLEAIPWDAESIRACAAEYDSAVFRRRIREFVANAQRRLANGSLSMARKPLT